MKRKNGSKEKKKKTQEILKCFFVGYYVQLFTTPNFLNLRYMLLLLLTSFIVVYNKNILIYRKTVICEKIEILFITIKQEAYIYKANLIWKTYILTYNMCT
jgi:hypothetical protein